MRGWVIKITVALAAAYGFAAAVSCGDDSGGNPDGGGGTGGSGGMTDASDATAGTVGCLPPEEVPVVCPTPKVTFANVQSIFQARCVSACHNGVTPDPTRPGETLWPLIDPAHILDWEDTVRGLVGDCSMPPQDAGIPMTIEERRAMLEFLRCEGRGGGSAAPLR